MNKLEYLAFTVTMIFAVCWIGTCCHAAEASTTEVPAVIYLQEEKTIEEVPTEIFAEPQWVVVCTNNDVAKIHEIEAEQYRWFKEQPAEAIEEPEESNEDESSNTLYFGTMECTAYVWTGNPCADGVYPSVNYTAACNDPALWHKWIYIEGIGDLYVHDTGAMASNVIDIFVGSHEEAIQFGRQVREVYVYE